MSKMIEIAPLENGAHRNQTLTFPIPEGWLAIPSNITIPSSFPFVDIEIEDNIITNLIEKEIPPVEEPDLPDPQMDLTEMVLDQEVRLTMLKLGLN